jgi:hypothetical protein
LPEAIGPSSRTKEERRTFRSAAFISGERETDPGKLPLPQIVWPCGSDHEVRSEEGGDGGERGHRCGEAEAFERLSWGIDVGVHGDFLVSVFVIVEIVTSKDPCATKIMETSYQVCENLR